MPITEEPRKLIERTKKKADDAENVCPDDLRPLPGTVLAQFAEELGVRPSLLLEQMRAAGIVKGGVYDPITQEDRDRLLDYLRHTHGRAPNAPSLPKVALPPSPAPPSAIAAPAKGITEKREAAIISGATPRSSIKGWVYVITNRAMPGLVKVGYSMQDPELRARELGHTGPPHPYEVDYEILVNQPRDIEQRAHAALASLREGREWFRCSVEEAVAAIAESIKHEDFYVESWKRAEREEVRAMVEQRRIEKERRRLADAEIQQTQQSIIASYERNKAVLFSEVRIWPYWIGWTIGIFVAISIVFDPKNSGAAFVGAMFCAWLAAMFHASHVEQRRQHSTEYKNWEAQKQAALDEARANIEQRHGI